MSEIQVLSLFLSSQASCRSGGRLLQIAESLEQQIQRRNDSGPVTYISLVP